MQSTGQTSTHERSLTLMHGSALTYGIEAPSGRDSQTLIGPPFSQGPRSHGLREASAIAREIRISILDTHEYLARAARRRNPYHAPRCRAADLCRARHRGGVARRGGRGGGVHERRHLPAVLVQERVPARGVRAICRSRPGRRAPWFLPLTLHFAAYALRDPRRRRRLAVVLAETRDGGTPEGRLLRALAGVFPPAAGAA